MTALRVGILGCGGIGGRHAEAIAALPDTMTLVANCGRSGDTVEAFCRKHGGAAYTDFGAMLAGEKLDLLVVALPPFAHDGQVEAAARAGVHVLVEKPIALDAARAQSMVDVSTQVGIVAACGFMYRFGDAVTQWDGLAAAGKTGPAAHFSGSFHCNALHAPWWRERAKSGGQMVEQLIHIVDLARHWMGMPQTVYAQTANLFHTDVPRYDCEDVSAMILTYANGAVAVLHASNAATPGIWRKGWQIVTRDMTGLFSDFNAAEFYSADPAADTRVISGDRDVFVAQLADVAGAVMQGRAPAVPLEEGRDTLRIVLAARQSADTGQPVALD